jgi:hypothetical protein
VQVFGVGALLLMSPLAYLSSFFDVGLFFAADV